MRRAVLAILAVVAALAALVWPWPAPEVDWQTPVEEALAATDCAAAIKVLDAAAGAGSKAAYDKLRVLVSGGTCDKQPVGEGARTYEAFNALYLERPADEIYRLKSEDLGWGRHGLVAGTLDLCAEPYNGAKRVDYVQLTKVVASGIGPVMALQDMRRETCLAILESVAERLIDAGDKPALRVAEALTMYPPLHNRPQAAVLYARLLLGTVYEPALPAKLVEFLRGGAWARLHVAAAQGHPAAVRLMIDYLHEGRYRTRDSCEAYRWNLRLRRFGEEHPLAGVIETECPQQERDYQTKSEALNWELGRNNR